MISAGVSSCMLKREKIFFFPPFLSIRHSVYIPSDYTWGDHHDSLWATNAHRLVSKNSNSSVVGDQYVKFSRN